MLEGSMVGKRKGGGHLNNYSDGLYLPRYFKGSSRAVRDHRMTSKTLQYSVLKLLRKFFVLMPFWRAGETQQKIIFQFPWEFYWTKDTSGLLGRLLVHEVCSTNKRARTREEYDVKGRTTGAGKEKEKRAARYVQFLSKAKLRDGLEERVLKA